MSYLPLSQPSSGRRKRKSWSPKEPAHIIPDKGGGIDTGEPSNINNTNEFVWGGGVYQTEISVFSV